MKKAVRKMTMDADWKLIQERTFLRWVNSHLKSAGTSVDNFEEDFSDGLKLIALVQVLSGKSLGRHNKKPNFRTQKLENVSIVLSFLEGEGVTLVNIDSSDIIDGKVKLLMSLVWTLILHYCSGMEYDEEDQEDKNTEEEDVKPEVKSPKQKLISWFDRKLPQISITNLTTDFQDGVKVGALVDSFAPGLCPDWEDWDTNEPVRNAKEAMDLAEDWLGVPKLLTPEELTNKNVDEMSMMTYLSQFPKGKLKENAPLRVRPEAEKVEIKGIADETSLANAKKKFRVETEKAGDAELNLVVIDPDGEHLETTKTYNEIEKVFHCSYFPTKEGVHMVDIRYGRKAIPNSPLQAVVEGFAGDASKVTIKKDFELESFVTGCTVGINLDTADAGIGDLVSSISVPNNATEIPKVTIVENFKGNQKMSFTPIQPGDYIISITFNGKDIPESPLVIPVHSKSDISKVILEPLELFAKNISCNQEISFSINTEGAGVGCLETKVVGPEGKELLLTLRNTEEDKDDKIHRFLPAISGEHKIIATWNGDHIPNTPIIFNVVNKNETSVTKDTTQIEIQGNFIDNNIVLEGQSGYRKNIKENITANIKNEENGLESSEKSKSLLKENVKGNESDFNPPSTNEGNHHKTQESIENLNEEESKPVNANLSQSPSCSWADLSIVQSLSEMNNENLNKSIEKDKTTLNIGAKGTKQQLNRDNTKITTMLTTKTNLEQKDPKDHDKGTTKIKNNQTSLEFVSHQVNMDMDDKMDTKNMEILENQKDNSKDQKNKKETNTIIQEGQKVHDVEKGEEKVSAEEKAMSLYQNKELGNMNNQKEDNKTNNANDENKTDLTGDLKFEAPIIRDISTESTKKQIKEDERRNKISDEKDYKGHIDDIITPVVNNSNKIEDKKCNTVIMMESKVFHEDLDIHEELKNQNDNEENIDQSKVEYEYVADKTDIENKSKLFIEPITSNPILSNISIGSSKNNEENEVPQNGQNTKKEAKVNSEVEEIHNVSYEFTDPDEQNHTKHTESENMEAKEKSQIMLKDKEEMESRNAVESIRYDNKHDNHAKEIMLTEAAKEKLEEEERKKVLNDEAEFFRSLAKEESIKPIAAGKIRDNFSKISSIQAFAVNKNDELGGKIITTKGAKGVKQQMEAVKTEDTFASKNNYNKDELKNKGAFGAKMLLQDVNHKNDNESRNQKEYNKVGETNSNKPQKVEDGEKKHDESKNEIIKEEPSSDQGRVELRHYFPIGVLQRYKNVHNSYRKFPMRFVHIFNFAMIASYMYFRTKFKL